MALLIESEPIPLEVDANGVVRVGGTRITLDTIVAAFSQGATAEEITHQYPSLHLADVYAVIAYYLRRRETVESYLQHRGRSCTCPTPSCVSPTKVKMNAFVEVIIWHF